jgi:uncharacterized protein
LPIAAAWLIATTSFAAAQQPVPPLTGHVVDATATLAPEALASLEAKLAAFEERKGSQIAALLVRTTAPEAIEEYSLRVAEQWRIGRGGVDDGVVLVIALEDRRMRFEVGYGLEGAVPDALARRIIAETIAPRFYEQDYAGGLDAGLDALIGLIDGEPLPVPIGREPEGEVRNEPFAVLPVVLVLALVVAPIFRRMFGSLFGSAALGVGAGLVVWVVSSVLFASLVAGAMVFVFALTGAGGGAGRWVSRGGTFGRMPGGFGGGGGGFRGGGGRFGGGGASGGW